MLRIWQKTEKQKLEPVGMGTAFPFLKEKNHVVSIIGGGGKTTLLYEMANSPFLIVFITFVSYLILSDCTTIIEIPQLRMAVLFHRSAR